MQFFFSSLFVCFSCFYFLTACLTQENHSAHKKEQESRHAATYGFDLSRLLQKPEYLLLKDQSGRNIAFLSEASCSPEAEKYELKIETSGPFSSDNFSLFLPLPSYNTQQQEQSAVEGQIEWIHPSDQTKSIKLPIQLSSDQSYQFIRQACAVLPKDIKQGFVLEESFQLKNIIKQSLDSFLPSCQWDLQNNSDYWKCHLKTQTLKEEQIALQDLEKKFLGKWQKVPYLLSRRLAITAQLQKLLASQDLQIKESSSQERSDRFQGELSGFCMILKNTASLEKPLILQEGKWLDMLCQTKNEADFRDIASISISASIRELKVLSSVVDASHLMGQMKFKIPKENLAKEQIFVRLEPSIEVKEELIKIHRNILNQKETNSSQTYAATSLFFHPIFDRDLSIIAMDLGFISHFSNNMNTVPQAPEAVPLINEKSISYLLTSILGETSFAVLNGQSKTLHLPKGAYTYTLSTDQENLNSQAQKSSPSAFSNGSFSWTSHPQATISKF